MADFTTPLDQAKPAISPVPRDKGNPSRKPLTGDYSDEELLDLWQVIKRESYDNRWVFERQWQRNIWYVLGRQWIEYQSKYGGWRDKRMAAWIPRPVTNKCKETVQSIRAMFASIALSVNVRPNGSDPMNVSAAATADELAPLLHEAHDMNQAMSEFDFWLCVTGNAFLHSYVDYDIKHGTIDITSEQCASCGAITESDKLAGPQPTCPECQGTQFTPALDEQGQPISRHEAKGLPSTMVLSPLEIAFPNAYTRFSDLPYITRSRWRTKRYYESHPVLKDLVATITWQKAPQDHSLALYTSLVQTNDLGITPIYWSEGSGRGGQNDEGIPEYEVWMKPSDAYPDGLVFRIIGDGQPIVIHLEDTEGLPGPLPYQDAEGKPLFPYAHGIYEHVGGRILGSGPLDVIIQKQDQLNQLDSLILLITQRMANPVWLEPKGAEIQKLTGMPGLVIKWNPLTVGGNAKPERIAGIPVDASLMQLREIYLKDIEELTGTFDIMKGAKPAGVEAFSAIQALIERSQARFSSVFRSRGDVYKDWFKFALELERQFGPDERTKAILTPARTWTFKNFKRAQLEGSVTIVIEDGSTTPKTNLGMRAAMEHANSLGMLNMQDPDQKYEGLKLMGLTRMIPTLDINIQSALQKQAAFEQWVQQPQLVQQTMKLAQAQQTAYEQAIQVAQQRSAVELGAAKDPAVPMPQPVQPPPPPPSVLDSTPLKWYPWYDAQIHMQEFIKWAQDDHIRELMKTNKLVEQFLIQHLQEIQGHIPKVKDPKTEPKVAFTFDAAALADPQVRELFDSVEGITSPVPPGAPGARPASQPQQGQKPAQGAARAMKNSNQNSGKEKKVDNAGNSVAIPGGR